MGLSIKIAFVAVLAGLALYFRGNVAKEKLRSRVKELKVVKRNRDMLIEAQRALYEGQIETERSVLDEIKRIKAGDRDHFPGGW